LAKNLQLTEAGKTHPMMRGRKDGDAVPCIHRDEIQKLPDGAVLLAGNAHSPVQAAVYEKDGIDYWGAQYHPELTPAFIAESLTNKGGFDDTVAEMTALASGAMDAPCEYTIELRNWLAHVEGRRTAQLAGACGRKIGKMTLPRKYREAAASHRVRPAPMGGRDATNLTITRRYAPAEALI